MPGECKERSSQEINVSGIQKKDMTRVTEKSLNDLRDEYHVLKNRYLSSRNDLIQAAETLSDLKEKLNCNAKENNKLEIPKENVFSENDLTTEKDYAIGIYCLKAKIVVLEKNLKKVTEEIVKLELLAHHCFFGMGNPAFGECLSHDLHKGEWIPK